MQIINWGIAKSPINWLTLFLMVLLAGIAIHFVIQHYQGITLGKTSGIAGK